MPPANRGCGSAAETNELALSSREQCSSPRQPSPPKRPSAGCSGQRLQMYGRTRRRTEKYQQQQEKLVAKQEQERQKLQQKQEQDHQQLARHRKLTK